MFLGVDWGAFVMVFLVALAATAAVVVFFSLGLRLLANGEVEPGAAGVATATAGGSASLASAAAGGPAAASPAASAPAARTAAGSPRPFGRTLGGWACIAVGAAAVLYSLYLIIPQFH